MESPVDRWPGSVGCRPVAITDRADNQTRRVRRAPGAFRPRLPFISGRPSRRRGRASVRRRCRRFPSDGEDMAGPAKPKRSRNTRPSKPPVAHRRRKAGAVVDAPALRRFAGIIAAKVVGDAGQEETVAAGRPSPVDGDGSLTPEGIFDRSVTDDGEVARTVDRVRIKLTDPRARGAGKRNASTAGRSSDLAETSDAELHARVLEILGSLRDIGVALEPPPGAGAGGERTAAPPCPDPAASLPAVSQATRVSRRRRRSS